MIEIKVCISCMRILIVDSYSKIIFGRNCGNYECMMEKEKIKKYGRWEENKYDVQYSCETNENQLDKMRKEER